MTFSYLFILFMIAGFAGWIYECIYCTLKTTHWQNRGFLFGPICPIYGFGFVGVYFLTLAQKGRNIPALSLPLVFVVCAAGSAVLEYFTSYLLEKLFHARWWDYSHVPLNLNGRICLPATCGFGAAGTIFFEFIIPSVSTYMEKLQAGIGRPYEEFTALLLMGFLGIDIGLSVSSITGLLNTLEHIESEFDEAMESNYRPIGKTQRVLAGKISGAGHTVARKIEGAGHRMAVLRKYAGRLSPRQINTLLNIESFSQASYKKAAEKMKEIITKKLSDGKSKQDKK